MIGLIAWGMPLPRFELDTSLMATQLQDCVMCMVKGNGSLESNAQTDLHVVALVRLERNGLA